MRKSLTAVAVLSMLALVPTLSSAGASTPTTLTGLSAQQIMSTSIKAAIAKKSATTVVTTSVLSIKVKEVTISGPHSGTGSEVIDGHKGEVIYLNGVVYAKFDAYLVNFNYGVKDNAVANKWISITKGRKFYSSLSSGITFPSVLQEMQPVGTLSASAPKIINGVSAIGITGNPSPSSGTTTGSETMYVATTAPFLPVEVLIKAVSSGITVVLTVIPKNWSVPVSVTAPKVFTSISKTKLP
jgi:hypothetical protein